MSDLSENNKLVVRRLMDAFASNDHAGMDALMSPDYIQHNPTPNGREPVKRMADTLTTAFPDMAIEIDDLIADGDTVVARMSMVGTHTGSLVGIPPTGRRVAMTSIDIWRVLNGTCVEHWDEVDRVGLIRQIGLRAVVSALLKGKRRRRILALLRENGIIGQRRRLERTVPPDRRS